MGSVSRGMLGSLLTKTMWNCMILSSYGLEVETGGTQSR